MLQPQLAIYAILSYLTIGENVHNTMLSRRNNAVL